MGKLYRSRIMAAIHETVEDLRGADLVARRTMRGFDAACLTSVRRLSAGGNSDAHQTGGYAASTEPQRCVRNMTH
jgi:hypothetical protein